MQAVRQCKVNFLLLLVICDHATGGNNFIQHRLPDALRRRCRVSVMVTPEEMRQIRRLAEDAEESVSSYVYGILSNSIQRRWSRRTRG